MKCEVRDHEETQLMKIHLHGKPQKSFAMQFSRLLFEASFLWAGKLNFFRKKLSKPLGSSNSYLPRWFPKSLSGLVETILFSESIFLPSFRWIHFLFHFTKPVQDARTSVSGPYMAVMHVKYKGKKLLALLLTFPPIPH